MTRIIAIGTWAILVVWCLSVPAAQAQLFGRSRSLRTPIARQPGMSQASQDVGTLQGNERFLRRNRNRTDFVGPDLRELARFIGRLEGRVQGQTRTMTQDLRKPTDRTAAVNQPLPIAPKGQLYYPRLSPGFPVPPVNGGWVEHQIVDMLARSPRLSATSRIEVSVEGRTATLRGEVPFEADRDLAELLASFEPGRGSPLR